MKNAAVTVAEAKPNIEAKEGAYKVASTTLAITTKERVELKTITEQIAEFVSHAPVRDGVVQISSLHTTAGIMLNEIQDALQADIKDLFGKVVPHGVYYKHNDPLFSDCDRQNADAHLRAIVVGPSLSIPIENGKLKLGTWQQVLFTEFDGPNNRKVHVQVMGI